MNSIMWAQGGLKRDRRYQVTDADELLLKMTRRLNLNGTDASWNDQPAALVSCS